MAVSDLGHSTRPVVLLTGAAEGLGASIAAAFAAAGHDIVGLARTDQAAAQLAHRVGECGGTYTHLCCDITQPDEVAATISPHAGRIAVFVHNTNGLLIKSFDETTLAQFELAWRVTCLGAFIVAKIVLPHMVARGSGTLILSSATAAMRGGEKFAAFASGKFALRGLGQSLAREYGSKGVHVAHVVLDGLIDEPQSDRRFGPAQSVRMDPDAVANAYLGLAAQHPSAWTQELDLRPCLERF